MFSLSFGRISLSDKILFYESIANLLDGWVTLLSALRWFASRLETWALKEAVENTIFFVEGGDLLNVAMRKIPNFYEEKEIAIVESGEQTGMMKNTFESIARELRMQEDLKRKVVGALTYPFIIMLFLLLALVVVMVYVIPQIMPVITEMAGELPWSTRSLVAVSDFMKHNILLFFILLLAFGLLFMGYTRTESGKRFIDKEKLYLPLIGKLYRNYLVVQVMSTFHLLLSSGVSILKALRLTGSSSGNRIIADIYNAVTDSVWHGNKLADSLQAADPGRIIFSADILQMIESAEKTSTVHEVSGKISEQYKREVDAALAVMVKFIEPVALLLAWVFVLWFAVAIFSAIMQVVTVAWV